MRFQHHKIDPAWSDEVHAARELCTCSRLTAWQAAEAYCAMMGFDDLCGQFHADVEEAVRRWQRVVAVDFDPLAHKRPRTTLDGCRPSL